VKVDDKTLAESVLDRLCVGAQVDGIRFGPVLQMLITHHGQEIVRGQVYLNLGSRWAVFRDSRLQLPASEDEPSQPVRGYSTPGFNAVIMTALTP